MRLRVCAFAFAAAVATLTVTAAPAAAATTATVTADNIKARTCPRISCTAVASYPRGAKVQIKCYTRTNTTPIEGDAGWALLTNGYYSPLHFLTWSGYINAC